MKLTENQIQELYVFTRKHYVEWYDLQTELVDHLANDIETLWGQNPEIPFEKALDLTFKKFGVFGFADVIAKRQKVLERKYYGMLWTFLKEYFRLPKIIFTVFLVCLFYFLISLVHKTYQLEIVMSIFLMLVLSSHYLTFRNKRRLEEDLGFGKRKFMLQEITISNSTIAQFQIFVAIIFNLHNFNINPGFHTMLFSFLLAVTILIGHISFFVLPQKINTYLSETYPEFIKSS